MLYDYKIIQWQKERNNKQNIQGKKNSTECSLYIKCKKRQERPNSSLGKGFHPPPRHPRRKIEEIMKIEQGFFKNSKELFQTVKTL